MNAAAWLMMALLTGLACREAPGDGETGGSLPVAGERGRIVTGAMQTRSYLPMLEDRVIGVVANQTSRIGGSHLVDSLVSLGVRIRCIFVPEHGLRGEAGAGAAITNGRDEPTGIPVISLYGGKFKPDSADLEGIDLVVFDLQDVGARFYTYISTLHYMMQACAEQKVALLVLDRPNPNGFYVDGPVLEAGERSFVGMHPVPVVHGMTMAEYARMIDGERWLGKGLHCSLSWVTCLNYDHERKYSLPVRPSPNLWTMNAVYLYPSLCFFEGTALSVGRGSPFPFEVFGHPSMQDSGFSFTPDCGPVPGKGPKLCGQRCFGTDLRGLRKLGGNRSGCIQLRWLLAAYGAYPDRQHFFNDYFDLLAGTPDLREEIEAGWDEERIRASWHQPLEKFKAIRKKYLLYPDF